MSAATDHDADTDVDDTHVDGIDDADEPTVGSDGGGGPRLTWPQLVVLVAAVAFLGGALVYFLDSRDSGPGAVDVGFYQDMTTHHDQAIELALLEVERGENATVRAFATEILIFQNRELGVMATRLADWGESPANRPATAMEWMGMPTEPSAMPGMATEDQIDQLADAEGQDADTLFLELIAEHHRGGLHMASYAAEHADDAEVRTLAARMGRFQAVEINEMAQTAERLGYPVAIERVEVPPEPGG